MNTIASAVRYFSHGSLTHDITKHALDKTNAAQEITSGKSGFFIEGGLSDRISGRNARPIVSNNPMFDQENAAFLSADSRRVDNLVTIVSSLNQTISLLNQALVAQGQDIARIKAAIAAHAEYIAKVDVYLSSLEDRIIRLEGDGSPPDWWKGRN